ncbi:MAG: glycerophosphodiester phosphodiesterase [Armatimonadetes bacterium]|nr:glycerophosphodiester phosphodiesterase [Armatimonadota bacterium]
MKRITVIGHRGAAGLEPENTLRSFRRACELGVDRVETDVHLTRDGRLVCIHDATVDRTTDGTGPVGEFTLEEIRRLDAGQGERIPTLEEALETVRGQAVLQIELKAGGTPAATIRALEAAGMGPEEVLLASFTREFLQEARALRPDLPVSHLFGPPAPGFVELAHSVGAKSISFPFRHLTPEWIEAAHDAGLEVRAYNPDTREEMKRVLALGVDGIGSNRPDLLLEMLRARGFHE